MDMGDGMREGEVMNTNDWCLLVLAVMFVLV
jgi:hypothetical protein